MLSLVNPWVILGLLLALAGFGAYEHHAGYQARVDEDQAEIVRLNEAARAKEAELNTKLAVANSKLKRAKDDVKTKQVNLIARADAGELRLPTCGVQADTSAPAAGGNSTNESDTERQTVKDLIAIAAEGDAAIIQLNSCIANYNSVRETVNAGVK